MEDSLEIVGLANVPLWGFLTSAGQFEAFPRFESELKPTARRNVIKDLPSGNLT
jgi:hypothetical protein